MNVLPDVYNCSLRKKSVPLLPEGTVKCTHLAKQSKFIEIHNIANLQTIPSEINGSGTIAKIRI